MRPGWFLILVSLAALGVPGLAGTAAAEPPAAGQCVSYLLMVCHEKGADDGAVTAGAELLRHDVNDGALAIVIEVNLLGPGQLKYRATLEREYKFKDDVLGRYPVDKRQVSVGGAPLQFVGQDFDLLVHTENPPVYGRYAAELVADSRKEGRIVEDMSCRYVR